MKQEIKPSVHLHEHDLTPQKVLSILLNIVWVKVLMDLCLSTLEFGPLLFRWETREYVSSTKEAVATFGRRFAFTHDAESG